MLHRWTVPHGSQALAYRINDSSLPPGLNRGKVLADIAAGFDVWNDSFNECSLTDVSDFAFSFSGTTQIFPPSLWSGCWCGDGVNQIAFASRLQVPFPPSILGELRIETDFATPVERVIEWDLIINAERPWTTSDLPSAYDIWNLIAHEAGHVVGVGHPGTCDYSPESYEHAALTMFGCIWVGDTWKRSLGLGDMIALEQSALRREGL